MALEARVAAADDAILGVAPRRAYWPESEAECAGVLARERGPLAFIGGGTALGLGAPPTDLEAVLHTGRLARVIEFAPADMVIAVEAGVTLAQLQAVARAERQMLALDAPHAEHATVGGLVATGAFGPRRARYGGIRDLIIGVTVVRADGVVARGGGKVVKNVAGFDLPKVLCGSLGTLGLVTAATFRLHPLPELSTTILFPGVTAEQVVELLAAARQAQLEPASAVALRVDAGRYDLGVRFEGFARGVREQTARAAALARAAQLPCEALADDAGFWRRHDRIRAAGPLRAKVCALPSELPGLDRLIAPLLAALRGGAFAWYASLGVGFAAGDPTDAGAASAALAAVRAELVTAGGSLVLEDAPPEVRAHVDPWGPAPGAFSLMVELKRRFDPHSRLNPGRFVGGL
jgi:glycolate oxidase FAD binding subunit